MCNIIIIQTTIYDNSVVNKETKKLIKAIIACKKSKYAVKDRTIKIKI